MVSWIGRTIAFRRDRLWLFNLMKVEAMAKLEKTVNGYAVLGRDVFLFKVGKKWTVVFTAWGGAKASKEFSRFAEAKKFALGKE